MSKMHYWKILYFHNTVKPHFTDSGLIRTVCFVPGKECLTANVEKTGTSQQRNNNSFNNNKSLAVQDESDMNTPQEETHTCNITAVTQCRRHRLLALHFL